METWVLALGVLVVIGAPIAGFLLWVKVFNGPDGERLQKLRMQGPLVPLSPEEIEDDRRKRGRSSAEQHLEKR